VRRISRSGFRWRMYCGIANRRKREFLLEGASTPDSIYSTKSPMEWSDRPLSRCIARVRRGGNRSRSLPFRSKGGGRRSPVRIFTRVFITTAIQETDRSGRSRSHKREDPSGEVQIRLDDYLCFDRNDPSWMICNVDPARGKETSSTWVSRFWF
jgi:hypothetical protein